MSVANVKRSGRNQKRRPREVALWVSAAMKAKAGNKNNTHAITAKATDNIGTVTTSAVTTLKISSSVAISMTSPVSNALYIAPAVIPVTAAVTDPDTTVSRVEFYNGSTLIGTATSAPYTFNWSNVAVGTYSLHANAIENNNGVTTTATVAISVNAAPAVRVTSPANNATFTGPANVTLTATDTNGTISKVEFYNGTTLLGTVTATPYTLALSNLGIGTYAITAVATDNLGSTTSSSPISFEVKTNGSPTIAITSPTNNANYPAPANITLIATATDMDDGQVAKVEFFNGTTLVGTATTVPYTASWNSVPLGTYSITAMATDNLGATTTSSPITINITNTSVPVYYIHMDHLNTPRMITDNTNTPVWRWESDPFGMTVPNDSLTGTTFTYNPRFPGQYFDKETNLHYNYFRDYDPTTGRYIQSDPIGLYGGVNTFMYVYGNPLIFTDKRGLEVGTVPSIHEPDQVTGGIGGSGQIGGQGSIHIGPAGVSQSAGVVAGVQGENGGVCFYRQVCVRVGPGIYAGAGGTVGGSAFTGPLSESGGASVGFGGDIGWGPSVGGQVTVGVNSDGITSGGVAKGVGGGGAGISLGVDFCWTTLICMESGCNK